MIQIDWLIIALSLILIIKYRYERNSAVKDTNIWRQSAIDAMQQVNNLSNEKYGRIWS